MRMSKLWSRSALLATAIAFSTTVSNLIADETLNQESVAPAASEPDMPAVAENQPTAPAAESAASEDAKPGLVWIEDYSAALKTAEAAGKPLVILFHNPADAERTAKFEREVLSAGAVRDLLNLCTLAKLPHDYRIKAGGADFELLKHASFGPLAGQPGLAVVDTVHKDSAQFRHVVASLPTAAVLPSQEALVAMLERQVPDKELAKLAELEWHDDYGEAIKKAEQERRMLFIYFRNESRDAEQDQFEREALSSVRVRRKLGRYVLARLTNRTEIKVQDQPVKLLDHASFSSM
jgi:hypothetical protein